jgi:UDP-3-O-[3-hydroxymyristoyl] N-acetylglucosamine deacetylase
LLALLADKDAWEEVTFEDASTAPISYAQPIEATI